LTTRDREDHKGSHENLAKDCKGPLDTPQGTAVNRKAPWGPQQNSEKHCKGLQSTTRNCQDHKGTANV